LLLCFRNLTQNLLSVVGSPDLIRVPLAKSLLHVHGLLAQLQTDMSSWPLCPKPNPDAFYPMDLFYNSEISALQQTLSHVEVEVANLKQVAQGQLSASARSLASICQLSHNLVPLSWLTHSFPVRISVAQWTRLMKLRLERLIDIRTTKDNPIIFNITDFARPDCFIQAVLQTFVRREFKVLQNCLIEVEVCMCVSSPFELYAFPSSGVASRSHSYRTSKDWCLRQRSSDPQRMLGCSPEFSLAEH
jgi:hypothetical protein